MCSKGGRKKWKTAFKIHKKATVRQLLKSNSCRVEKSSVTDGQVQIRMQLRFRSCPTVLNAAKRDGSNIFMGGVTCDFSQSEWSLHSGTEESAAYLLKTYTSISEKGHFKTALGEHLLYEEQTLMFFITLLSWVGKNVYGMHSFIPPSQIWICSVNAKYL